MSDIYKSPVYGEGTIVSRANDETVVRFDSPPGMVHKGGAQLVPVIHFASTLFNAEGKDN
jgi:hypothetical protein